MGPKSPLATLPMTESLTPIEEIFDLNSLVNLTSTLLEHLCIIACAFSFYTPTFTMPPSLSSRSLVPLTSHP